MKIDNRVMSLLALTSGAAAATSLINRYIRFSAVSKKLLTELHPLCFKWRFGNIYFTKTGSGKPLLLIHDFHFASSGCEWSQIIGELKKRYTVYTIDLLGFGRSEKPNLTYTNYLYVQLISDFIKSEIGHRTNVIATGGSVALTVMACNANPELFDQIALINPDPLSLCGQVYGKNARLYKLILDLPIAGTLFYHIASSRRLLEEAFRERFFYNPYSAKPAYIDRYYEASHLGGCPKDIFSSMECGYTKCNISNALKKIDNSIFIIGGAEEPSIADTIDEYRHVNPAVEYALIPKTKHLPQLEQPEKVLNLLTIFFS